jgi:hypothetical protein
MAKITSQEIIKRHKQFPDATSKLIEAYAFQEYQKAIADLERLSDTIKVKNTDTTIIVINNTNYHNWHTLQESHWYINKDVTGEL